MRKETSRKLFILVVLSTLLTFLTALGSIGCVEQVEQDLAKTSQKYLFEVSTINAAWGYVNHGIYIDSQGRVYGYDLSQLGWRDAARYHPENGVYPEALLEEKFSVNQQYFQTVDMDTLTKMFKLIAPASRGSLTDPKNMGADMGGTGYSAFLFDKDSGNYKEVLLYTEGDWTVENTSKEAKVLLSWLSGFSTSPYPKYQGLDLAIRESLRNPVGTILASDLEGITRLSAASRGISDISQLENCPRLERLDIFENNISDIGTLSKLVNLVYLDIGRNQISDISPLSDLTNLTSLICGGNKIKDLSPLSNLTDLTSLSVGFGQIEDISALINLTNLRQLGLSMSQLSDISPLSNLNSLNDLALDRNQIVDIRPLSNLTNLTVLWLDENQIEDIAPISNLSNLTRLYIRQNHISDISPLTNLHSLRELYLGGNEISDIQPLVANSGISNYDLVDLTLNPLSNDSINIYIPQLRARGVDVRY